MALSSMTGFARGHGITGAYAWSWEVKSVNAKGIDLRFRMPAGWDAVEVPARARASEKLSRGTVYANLTVERKGVQPTAKINEPVLSAILSTLKTLSGKVEAAPASLDGILSLKGVIEVTEEDEREEDHRAAETAIIAGFEQALASLVAMRRAEGATLGRLLTARLDEIAVLAARCFRPRSASTPTDSIRKRSCSPPRPISARSLIVLPRMWRRQRSLSTMVARSAASSIFWRRNCTANRIR